MTDTYKGFIVHLDKEIRDEDSEHILTALKMVKHVRKVEPLISEAEDTISYMRGIYDMKMKFVEFLRSIKD